MSRKPKPELLGSEEFLRQHQLIEMDVGARQVFRLSEMGEEKAFDKSVTVAEMFGGGFFFGADELGVDCRKAGFPRYPTRATMAELETIAEQYVGTAPDIKDPKNLDASRAWVLANFAAAEYYRQKFMNENNFVEVWGIGVLMGRLAEWWAWRREGHDRNAISGAAHRENTATGRQAAASEKKPRTDRILDEIDRLESTGLSPSAAFRRAVKNGFGVSEGANRALYYRNRRKL